MKGIKISLKVVLITQLLLVTISFAQDECEQQHAACENGKKSACPDFGLPICIYQDQEGLIQKGKASCQIYAPQSSERQQCLQDLQQSMVTYTSSLDRCEDSEQTPSSVAASCRNGTNNLANGYVSCIQNPNKTKAQCASDLKAGENNLRGDLVSEAFRQNCQATVSEKFQNECISLGEQQAITYKTCLNNNLTDCDSNLKRETNLIKVDLASKMVDDECLQNEAKYVEKCQSDFAETIQNYQDCLASNQATGCEETLEEDLIDSKVKFAGSIFEEECKNKNLSKEFKGQCKNRTIALVNEYQVCLERDNPEENCNEQLNTKSNGLKVQLITEMANDECKMTDMENVPSEIKTACKQQSLQQIEQYQNCLDAKQKNCDQNFQDGMIEMRIGLVKDFSDNMCDNNSEITANKDLDNQEKIELKNNCKNYSSSLIETKYRQCLNEPEKTVMLCNFELENQSMAIKVRVSSEAGKKICNKNQDLKSNEREFCQNKMGNYYQEFENCLQTLQSNIDDCKAEYDNKVITLEDSVVGFATDSRCHNKVAAAKEDQVPDNLQEKCVDISNQFYAEKKECLSTGSLTIESCKELYNRRTENMKQFLTVEGLKIECKEGAYSKKLSKDQQDECVMDVEKIQASFNECLHNLKNQASSCVSTFNNDLLTLQGIYSDMLIVSGCDSAEFPPGLSETLLTDLKEKCKVKSKNIYDINQTCQASNKSETEKTKCQSIFERGSKPENIKRYLQSEGLSETCLKKEGMPTNDKNKCSSQSKALYQTFETCLSTLSKEEKSCQQSFDQSYTALESTYAEAVISSGCDSAEFPPGLSETLLTDLKEKCKVKSKNIYDINQTCQASNKSETEKTKCQSIFERGSKPENIKRYLQSEGLSETCLKKEGMPTNDKNKCSSQSKALYQTFETCLSTLSKEEKSCQQSFDQSYTALESTYAEAVISSGCDSAEFPPGLSETLLTDLKEKCKVKSKNIYDINQTCQASNKSETEKTKCQSIFERGSKPENIKRYLQSEGLSETCLKKEGMPTNDKNKCSSQSKALYQTFETCLSTLSKEEKSCQQSFDQSYTALESTYAEAVISSGCDSAEFPPGLSETLLTDLKEKCKVKSKNIYDINQTCQASNKSETEKTKCQSIFERGSKPENIKRYLQSEGLSETCLKKEGMPTNDKNKCSSQSKALYQTFETCLSTLSKEEKSCQQSFDQSYTALESTYAEAVISSGCDSAEFPPGLSETLLTDLKEKCKVKSKNIYDINQTCQASNKSETEKTKCQSIFERGSKPENIKRYLQSEGLSETCLKKEGMPTNDKNKCSSQSKALYQTFETCLSTLSKEEKSCQQSFDQSYTALESTYAEAVISSGCDSAEFPPGLSETLLTDLKEKCKVKSKNIYDINQTCQASNKSETEKTKCQSIFERGSKPENIKRYLQSEGLSETCLKKEGMPTNDKNKCSSQSKALYQTFETCLSTLSKEEKSCQQSFDQSYTALESTYAEAVISSGCDSAEFPPGLSETLLTDLKEKCKVKSKNIYDINQTCQASNKSETEKTKCQSIFERGSKPENIKRYLQSEGLKSKCIESKADCDTDATKLYSAFENCLVNLGNDENICGQTFDQGFVTLEKKYTTKAIEEKCTAVPEGPLRVDCIKQAGVLAEDYKTCLADSIKTPEQCQTELDEKIEELTKTLEDDAISTGCAGLTPGDLYDTCEAGATAIQKEYIECKKKKIKSDEECLKDRDQKSIDLKGVLAQKMVNSECESSQELTTKELKDKCNEVSVGLVEAYKECLKKLDKSDEICKQELKATLKQKMAYEKAGCTIVPDPEECMRNVDTYISEVGNCDQAANPEQCKADIERYKQEMENCEKDANPTECKSMVNEYVNKVKQCNSTENPDACRAKLESDLQTYRAEMAKCDAKESQQAKDQCKQQIKDYIKGQKQCDQQGEGEEKKRCLARLEFDIGSAQCSYSGGSDLAKQQSTCQGKGGMVWNCVVETCLTEAQNEQLKQAYMNCKSKPSEAEQQQCLNELEDLGRDLKSLKEKIEFDIQDMQNLSTKLKTKATVTLGLVTAISVLNLTNASMKGCASSMILAAAAVIGIMTEKKSAEKIKSDLEAIQKEMESFLGQNMDSINLQVEALEKIKEAYLKVESLMREKAKSYNLLIGLYGAAMAMAIVEMMPPMNASCPMSGMTAAVAGIAMGLTSQLKKICMEIAETMSARAKFVQQIIDKFPRLIPGSSVTPEKSGAILNKIKNGSIYDILESIFSVAFATSKDEKFCINQKGQEDKKCACRAKDKCFKIDLKQPDISSTTSSDSAKQVQENMQQLIKEVELKDLLREVNLIANGKKTFADLDYKKMEMIAEKNQKIAEKLLANANAKLKKQGKKPLLVDDTMIANYVKKFATPETIKKFKNGPYDSFTPFFEMNLSKLQNKKINLKIDKNAANKIQEEDKKFRDQYLKNYPKTAWDNVMLFDSSKMKDFFKINFKEKIGQEPGQVDQYEIGDADISKGDTNLFEIISNRYLKTFRMRKEK